VEQHAASGAPAPFAGDRMDGQFAGGYSVS
jgi:hypothetical protein